MTMALPAASTVFYCIFGYQFDDGDFVRVLDENDEVELFFGGPFIRLSVTKQYLISRFRDS